MSIAGSALVPLSGTPRGRLHWFISTLVAVLEKGSKLLICDEAPATRVTVERNSHFAELYNGKDFYFSTYMDLKVMQQYARDGIHDQLMELNPLLANNWVGQQARSIYVHERANSYLVRGLMDPLGSRLMSRFSNSIRILEREDFVRSLLNAQSASSLNLRVFSEPENITSRNLSAPNSISVRAMAVFSVMTSSSQEPFVSEVMSKITATNMIDLRTTADAQQNVYRNTTTPNPTIPGLSDLTVEKIVEFFMAQNRQHLFDIQLKFPAYSTDNLPALCHYVFGLLVTAMRYPDIILLNLSEWMKELFIALRALCPSDLATFIGNEGFIITAAGVRENDSIMGAGTASIRNGTLDYSFLRPVAGDAASPNSINRLRAAFGNCLTWYQPTIRARTVNSGGLSLDPSTSSFTGPQKYAQMVPSEQDFRASFQALRDAVLFIVKQTTKAVPNSVKAAPLKSIEDSLMLLSDFYYESLGVQVVAALAQQLLDPKFIPSVSANVFSNYNARQTFFSTCVPLVLTHPDRPNGISARIVKERKVVTVSAVFEYVLILRTLNKISAATKEKAVVLLPELSDISWTWHQTLLWNAFYGLRALLTANSISQSIQPGADIIGVPLPTLIQLAARANTEHAMKSSEFRQCFFAILKALGGDERFYNLLSFSDADDFRALMPNIWGHNGVSLSTLTRIPNVTHTVGNVPQQWPLEDEELNGALLDIDSVITSPTYGASNDNLTTINLPLIVGEVVFPMGDVGDQYGVVYPNVLQDLENNGPFVVPAAPIPNVRAANNAYIVTQDSWRVAAINNSLNAYYELQILVQQAAPNPAIWTSISHSPKATFNFPRRPEALARSLVIPQFILAVDPLSVDWINLEEGKKNVIYQYLMKNQILLALINTVCQPRFYGFNAKEQETFFGDLSQHRDTLLNITKNFMSSNGSIILEPVFVDQRHNSAFIAVNRRRNPDVAIFYHAANGEASLPIPLLRVSHGPFTPPVYNPALPPADTILLEAYDPGQQNDVELYERIAPGEEKFDREAYIPNFFNEATFHRTDCLTITAPPAKFFDSLTEARNAMVWE